ncbi:MAG TPA: 23S rRNA (adenine(2503)-C(2))-methyltransferase RlmN [Terriglobales bacterium]|nr:23S rRNA (adenine(2503)-C(2))-methyltransferase RlmN [Terriglobales bacterium]
MSHNPQFVLLGLDQQELSSWVVANQQPAFRSKQLAEAIYRQQLSSLEEITTLPQSFRSEMAQQGLRIGWPEISKRFVSRDGTVRYLISFADGESVETVWMPEGDGGEAGDGSDAYQDVAESHRHDWHRATICVSSQVGCAVNCQFCLTAKLGVKRNLTAGEIVGQVLVILRDQGVDLGSERINLVFMGMGEPFLNYENFMKAVRLLVEEVGIPESRMTVSTAGIVPRIEEFGREPIRPKLAISLNGSNDVQREQVMPLNRKWDLKQLLDAARAFPLRNRERMTFEYVLLNGVNDSPQNAREVVRLLNGIRAKVNLIALNPGPDIPFATPDEQRVLAFQQILVDANIPAFVRRPRGRDIFAACGQLKRTEELVAIGT